MGSIALIWEDGIVLGGLILLSLTQPNHESIRILNVFLIVYSALLTRTFWQTGAGTIGYLAAFGLGLAVRLWHTPWLCFAVAASVYLLVYEGLGSRWRVPLASRMVAVRVVRRKQNQVGFGKARWS